MTGSAGKFIVAGLMGLEVLFAQAIRTGWREWPFPESLQDPPIRPTLLAANQFGDLYVVDGDNYRILLFPGDGSHPKTAGGWGDQRDLFTLPTDIDASPGLDVLVCDMATHRILVFDRQLNYVGEKVLTNLGPDAVNLPFKMGQNQLGELVVVSSGDWELTLISGAGRLVATMGGAAYGRNRFGEISDLSMGPEDQIGLVDVSEGVFMILSRTGYIRRKILLPEPDSRLVQWWRDRWLVMGPSGHLYDLSPSTGDFRLIPSTAVEEPALVPRDFAVVKNVVYVADETSGKLYSSTLRSLEY
ncbi:MAG: hypothetical protein ACE5HZ_09055 [Fidelibacterota bacterium]